VLLPPPHAARKTVRMMRTTGNETFHRVKADLSMMTNSS
jgi:hypothetical protein